MTSQRIILEKGATAHVNKDCSKETINALNEIVKNINHMNTNKTYLNTVTPCIFSMWEHSSWGNSIYFTDWDKRRIAGHLTPLPKVGDVLRCKMKSGKIARFKFEVVDVLSDPRDQFFATVSFLGYEI